MNIEAFVAGAEHVRPYTVMYGRDKDVIPLLLDLHATARPDILDCTYNKGRMWKGLDYKPLKMDLCDEYDVDVVGDFRDMPFPDDSFDVIVFDPPHLPTAAGNKTVYTKYKVEVADKDRAGENISDLFVPFLKQAKRVLRKNGIVLAKLADLVHNHRAHWHQVDFINAVREVGLTPCDMLIKIDPAAGNLKDNRWKKVKHLRKAHCYWIVVRKGKCEKCDNLATKESTSMIK